MKKSKNSGISPLKLALIITGSIVAAVGIIMLVIKFIKKKQEQKALEAGECGCDCCADGWEFDEDMLGELDFDDDDECCECDNCVSDEISEAVDEAIEAIGDLTDDEE